MQILRIPPYNTTVDIQVDDPNTDYPVIIRDMADLSISTLTLQSDSDSLVSVDLSAKYDGEYLIQIYDDETIVEVVRPYVDPTNHGDTASEVTEYRKNEEVARAIIDSVVTEGFYFKKEVIEVVGNGADYIPLWINAHKVLSVYENNVLVYDSAHPENYTVSYEITKDRTAITKAYSGEVNRAESAYLAMPTAGSDIIGHELTPGVFPKTYDYVITVESGYKKVPSDIVRATEMLVDDIACGKLDYYKRYISDYNTDQFKLRFDSRSFEGTGNIIVDKILSKYVKTIRSIGVL